ncbi:MAG TPA: preprotein translocase subunit SecY [Verrucomicrobiae bacterium]|jgi:preprotein translocase subunit SecY|nr:preprotein translocase subunit SecY [Verrucomicrobiae bacterium]
MFRSIANTFSNCFKIPELKSRIIFTVVVLAICRLTAYIHIPGLDATALNQAFDDAQRNGGGGPLGLLSAFSGGAIQNCAIGALTIIPYISATIIIQLLTAVVPQLSKMAREEGGRAKIIQYGRYLTVLLCLGQGLLTAIGYEHPESVLQIKLANPLVLYPEHWIWWYRIQTMFVLTTGTMLLMWLGEQITDRGIGNGVSLIITINILSRLPQAVLGVRDMFAGAGPETRGNIGHAIALLLLLAGVIAGIIAVTQAERKIPVTYAQRAVGRKVYAGGTNYMPLRVNYAGVMPVIFAQSILMFPQKAALFMGKSFNIKFFIDIANYLNEGGFLYIFLYSLLILFFSYFWVATQFNELQIADDLKKNGGYIPGVRPGQATSDYLHNTMSRITLAGAIFLVIISVIPIILGRIMHVPWTVSQFFGGTSMLIAVGVMLDTMRQMESHLLMRHYDGFLKKGRVKGRF